MSFRRVEIGMVPGYVGRVSFTGDLGFEIWVTTDYQRVLYDLLVKAGREFGLKLFGGRALNAMASRRASAARPRSYCACGSICLLLRRPYWISIEAGARFRGNLREFK